MLAANSITITTSGAQRADRARPTMILVHGAFQDSRAWDLLLPLLRARGVNAIAVNLPGRASDTTSRDSVTLDRYRDAVLKVIAEQRGPVTLVGHSFGGITISSVAEAMPERIRALVYVAAYLPTAGASDQSMAKLSEADQWNKFNKSRQNFLVTPDYRTASVLADDQVMLFCADCSADAKARTLAVLQREPLPPAATPVVTTAARFGAVRKFYIHTTNDNAVSYTFQQQMVGRTPVQRAFTLKTGHSPFLEAPAALADTLASIR